MFKLHNHTHSYLHPHWLNPSGHLTVAEPIRYWAELIRLSYGDLKFGHWETELIRWEWCQNWKTVPSYARWKQRKLVEREIRRKVWQRWNTCSENNPGFCFPISALISVWLVCNLFSIFPTLFRIAWVSLLEFSTLKLIWLGSSFLHPHITLVKYCQIFN